MDVSTFKDHLQSFLDYSAQIVYREVIPAVPNHPSVATVTTSWTNGWLLYS